MLQTSLTVRLDADPRSVGIARTIFQAALERLGVTEDCNDAVVLAVAEACTNAVEHANPDRGAFDAIEVRIDVTGTWCLVEVIDHGSGFDPGAAPQGFPAPDEVRGRGMALMNELADEVIVQSAIGAGTRVLLTKRLAVEGWSPLSGPREAGVAANPGAGALPDDAPLPGVPGGAVPLG
jgi:serine/threonine-protein kinase RsbW